MGGNQRKEGVIGLLALQDELHIPFQWIRHTNFIATRDEKYSVVMKLSEGPPLSFTHVRIISNYKSHIACTPIYNLNLE